MVFLQCCNANYCKLTVGHEPDNEDMTQDFSAQFAFVPLDHMTCKGKWICRMLYQGSFDIGKKEKWDVTA